MINTLENIRSSEYKIAEYKVQAMDRSILRSATFFLKLSSFQDSALR